jgi:glutamate 5-kinase
MSPLLSPSPFAKAKTIVVKLGSAVLTRPEGGLDLEVMRAICSEIAELVHEGRRVILVTSAAVAAGRAALGVRGKPTIAEKQALAAVGQSRIMGLYSKFFEKDEIVVGQMLLTRGDMEDRRRYVNARYTLAELLRRRCVPIINENDTVTVDELRFGDNDGLAALVAVRMQAEALLLLSDVDGVYSANPKSVPDAKLLERIDKVTPQLVEELCPQAKPGSSVGSGGMTSKLLAARVATRSGVCVAIAHGKTPRQIHKVLSGDFKGTFFACSPRRLKGRREWIVNKRSAIGRRVVIDEGARTALIANKKSLLPAGIRKVVGAFRTGDVVEISDASGQVLGRGIVNYSSGELEQIRGRKTSEIASILGYKPYDEAIHRDNLALSEQV